MPSPVVLAAFILGAMYGVMGTFWFWTFKEAGKKEAERKEVEGLNPSPNQKVIE